MRVATKSPTRAKALEPNQVLSSVAYKWDIDRVMVVSAYGYLTLPPVLFVLGWLQWYLALPMAAVLVVACHSALREESRHRTPTFLTAPGARKNWRIVLLILLAWFFLSGLGGYTFQNADHHWRNALFRDLVYCKWPVIATINTLFPQGSFSLGEQTGLVYYIGHWLPAALLGKLFGLRAAHHALFLWSLLGGVLAFYFYFKYLGTVKVWLALIFIGFSGMEVVGWYIFNNCALPSPIQHIEWWAQLMQYSSVTTTLYWVFNQTIGVWLIVMLLLNQRTSKNLFFLYATSFIIAPYPAIGLLPIVLCRWYTLARQGEHAEGAQDAVPPVATQRRFSFTSWVSLQNCLPPLLLALVCGFYYVMNTAAGTHKSGWLFVLCGSALLPRVLIIYVAFCLLQFGIYFLIMRKAFAGELLFWVTGISLALIPLYRQGIYNDFVMRVSIPLLLVLMTFAARYFLIVKRPRRSPWRAILLILLLLGGWTPMSEMLRSIYCTYCTAQHTTFADAYDSLSDTDSDSLMAQHYNEFAYLTSVKKSIFFRYLARMPEE